jgi:hypothetical protein
MFSSEFLHYDAQYCWKYMRVIDTYRFFIVGASVRCEQCYRLGIEPSAAGRLEGKTDHETI